MLFRGTETIFDFVFVTINFVSVIFLVMKKIAPDKLNINIVQTSFIDSCDIEKRIRRAVRIYGTQETVTNVHD